VVGAPGTATGSVNYPKAMNALVGTKFKIVSGYPGGNDVNLAMERGEVGGRRPRLTRRPSPRPPRCGKCWRTSPDPALTLGPASTRLFSQFTAGKQAQAIDWGALDCAVLAILPDVSIRSHGFGPGRGICRQTFHLRARKRGIPRGSRLRLLGHDLPPDASRSPGQRGHRWRRRRPASRRGRGTDVWATTDASPWQLCVARFPGRPALPALRRLCNGLFGEPAGWELACLVP
jgi:hypothetical protein